MTKISLKLAIGKEIDFEVDTDLTGTAYFVFGVRKSGSSIFTNICKAMAAANSRRFVDVGHALFLSNVTAPEWNRDPALSTILYPQNVYGGFRNVPFGILTNPLFLESPTVLMVRDPRDGLVSQYFSTAYSHPVPVATSGSDSVAKHLEAQRAAAQATPIDDYVLRSAKQYNKTMMDYADVARLPRTKVLKYEENILEKAKLIRTTASHFDWSADDALIEQILAWADVRPTAEDPKAFIRKVTPGDHREKLRPETIAELNRLLHPAMNLFGYSPD